MTWSYSKDPSTSSLDAVRFLIEDTDETDQLLADEEINWVVTQESGATANVYLAGALCCERIATRYSRQADKMIGSAQLRSSQKQAQFAKRAAELRARQAHRVKVYAGGISISDKQGVEADTDRVKPAFTRDMTDQPGQNWTPDNRNALLGAIQ